MIVDALVPQLKARGCKVEMLDDEVVRADMHQDVAISYGARGLQLRRFVLTCRQLESSGVFVIGVMDSAEQAEIVCNADIEIPAVSAQKILRKLEQLEYFAPFGNNDHYAYSDEEEASVTQHLAELGYV